MARGALPQAGQWNAFWQKRGAADARHPSFSKRRILNVIQPYVTRGKYALDAGCGSGFFARYFCEEGMHTSALDYSAQALALTKEATDERAQIIQADLLNPDITGEISDRFDLIFSDGLFEHFSSDDQNLIMLNMSKLLRPNGIIATFVPNRRSPWELIRPLFMPGIEEEPFTLAQLEELNRRNHLAVIRKGGINTLPMPFSPDRLLGASFGMLLYTLSKKKTEGSHLNI